MAANPPKSVKMRISEVLSDLSPPEFKKFVNQLREHEGEPRIRRNSVENKDHLDIAELLVQFFSENGALRVAVKTLKQANFNKQAEELELLSATPKLGKNSALGEKSLLMNHTNAAGGESSVPPPSNPPSVSSGGTSGEDSVDEHRLEQIGRTGTLAKGRFGRADKEEDNDTWAAIKSVPQQLIRKDLERKFEVYNQANPPYGHAVGRMVHPDPTLRASIGEVKSDIRGAVGAGIFINTPHLQPPSSNINAMNWDPLPMMGTSLFQRDPLLMRRDPLLFDLDHSPINRATTGRLVMQDFVEKNGHVEKWEQKEVVTRDGKIMKYDIVKFNK